MQIRKNSAKVGSTVGAAVLGIGVLGAGLGSEGFAHPGRHAYGSLIIFSSMMGFASGALLGAAVGSLIPKWNTVYEARPAPDQAMRSLESIEAGADMPAPSDVPAAGATANTDTLAFAAVSKRVRPGSNVRVFPSMITVDPMSCRGTALALEGFRCGSSENRDREGSERRTLRWTEISTVQIRENSARRGGSIGAAFVGVGVLVVGMATNNSLASSMPRPGGSSIVLYSMVGFVSGGILGAAVGSLIPKWSTVYEARSTPDERSR